MKNIILKWITTPKKQKNAYLKIVLCCNVVSICLLTPYANAALSATTANVIQGTGPYLSFDNGATPELTTEKLLTITIDNKDYTVADAGTWKDPIQLPASVTTVDQVKSYVTKTVGITGTVANIFNIAKTNKLGYDSDGDEIISGEGTVSIDWKDFRGFTVTGFQAPLDPCFGPYQLTVTTTAASLTTKYGLPLDSTIVAPEKASVTYYIAPPEPATAKVCYAAPFSGEPNIAGTEWNTTYQWFNNVTTGSKFPTTGFDQATFILRIVGSKNTPTLTVSSGAYIGGNITRDSSIKHPGNSSKITLTGTTFGNVSSSNKVVVPANFNVTVDSTPVYHFSIKKWFLPGPKKDQVNMSDSTTKCTKLVDVTNYYKVLELDDMTTATNNDKSTLRSIAGGAVAEWGSLGVYDKSDWVNTYYWVAKPNAFSSPQSVGGKTGYYTTGNDRNDMQNWGCVRRP